jgi:hypothetical protein
MFQVTCKENFHFASEKFLHGKPTPESKIYTSPPQIIIKFGIHIGPIAEHLHVTFVSIVKLFLKYRVLKHHPHQGKKVCAQGFSSITPLIMHLEKHSRPHCNA